jgi:hypothetical protein
VAGSHEGGKFTDGVVALLNDKFVPFAPGMFDTRKGYAWWDTTMKATWPKLNQCTVPGTLWFTITSTGQIVPAGKVEGFRIDGTPKVGLPAVLRQVLKSYARLPEAERRPAKPLEEADRPGTAPPPGGLALTVYDHPLVREDGRYQRMTQRTHFHVRGPQRDCLWLTAAECRSLLPEAPRKGQTDNVPASLAKRIVLFGLLPHVCWQGGMHWDANSFRRGELKLTVAEISPSRVRLRIHGSGLLVSKAHPEYGVDRATFPKDFENRLDARLEGVLEYDPVRKKIGRWDMAALGDYVGGLLRPRPPRCLADDASAHGVFLRAEPELLRGAGGAPPGGAVAPGASSPGHAAVLLVCGQMGGGRQKAGETLTTSQTRGTKARRDHEGGDGDRAPRADWFPHPRASSCSPAPCCADPSALERPSSVRTERSARR